MNLVAHNAHIPSLGFLTTPSSNQVLDFFEAAKTPGRRRWQFKVVGVGGGSKPTIYQIFNGGGVGDPGTTFKNFPIAVGPILKDNVEFISIDIVTRLIPIVNNNFNSSTNPKRWRTVLEMTVVRDFTNETEQTDLYGLDFTARATPTSSMSKWVAMEVIANPSNPATNNTNGQFFYDWVSMTPSTYTPSSLKVLRLSSGSQLYGCYLSLGTNWRMPFIPSNSSIVIIDDILKTSALDSPQSGNFANKSVIVLDLDISNASAGVSGVINFNRYVAKNDTGGAYASFAGQTAFPVNSSNRTQFVIDMSTSLPTITARNY